MMQNNPRICIVSLLFHEAFVSPLYNLKKVIFGLSNKSRMIVCQSTNIECYPENMGKDNIDIINHKISSNTISRIFNYIMLNLEILTKMRVCKACDDIYLFFCESGLLLPIILGKLRGKKIIWLLPSNFNTMLFHQKDTLTNVLIIPHGICYLLVDYIVLYSPKLIQEWNLQKYSDKILIAHRHFLDFNTFTVTTPLSDRTPFIGYIGRLSGEKGVQHFAQALPVIFGDQQDLRVLIGGDGQLKEAIEATLQKEGLTDRVDLPGWISHDDLPGYLNQLRLLVFPSYTEGLPNIMLEAMACGTPVLATPVGAIPDVIIDGKTGFIMENNSPECISENVIRALGCPELEQIAENGRRFVKENFTFEKTVENWKGVLQGIE